MKLLVAFLIATNFILSAQVLAQTCPECYSNRGHLTGHGTTADGRTRANIYIETPQGTSEYAMLNGAVGGASNDWNTATDGSGNHINYQFEQVYNPTDADFIVTIGNPAGGCAQIDTTVFPHVITVSALALQQSTGDLEAVFEHELGHRLGLAEAANTAACGSSTTIMRGAHTCVPVIKQIQASDVAQARHNYSNPTTCTRTAPPTASDVEEGGCNASSQESCLAVGRQWDYVACTCVGGESGDACAHSDQCTGGLVCISGTCQSHCDPNGENWCSAHEGDWVESTCTCHYSPIIVDVAGNGFDLTNNAQGVRFDLDRDGIKEHLSWTTANSDDAFVALDRNGNGIIDDGSELFGNFTSQPSPAPGIGRNGFNAIAKYDRPENGGNADGKIDSNDVIFRSLLLWQDTNHNGTSEAEELKTFPQVGLKTLELDYKESNRTDQYGNQFRYRAKTKDIRGEQVGRWAWDIFLVSTP